MKEKDFDYMHDLEVSTDQIDNLVDTHSNTSMKYHELFVDKIDVLNEQKRQVKLKDVEVKEVYAKLYLANKQLPTKITEKENDSMILIHPEYKKIQKEYYEEIKKLNKIESDYILFEGVIKNMQGRKNMIEEKIKLINMGLAKIKQKKDETSFTNKLNNKLNKI